VTVASWWERWPDANVGLRCDGLLVIDIDGDQGERSFERLQIELGGLPASREQQTGGGRHLLFAANLDSNSTRPLGNPPGIDLRGGQRGYIVTSPSLHRSGCRYRWLDERPIGPLPAPWLERLQGHHHGQPQAPRSPGTHAATGYGRAALNGELERLLRAPVGARNQTLNVAAFRLGQLVAAGELPYDLVEQEAWTVALLIGLGPSETRGTIRSALRAGMRHPRSASRARARERGLRV
jgi:hypothetical protein